MRSIEPLIVKTHDWFAEGAYSTAVIALAAGIRAAEEDALTCRIFQPFRPRCRGSRRSRNFAASAAAGRARLA